MSEKIEFELEVKSNGLNKALDDASKKAFSLEGALNTALGVFGGGLALKWFDLLGGAIGDSIDFAKESIKAFSEQEDALNKLGQALKSTGSFTEDAINDFSAYASELQRTSKFGDELVLSQLAVAKSFGATNSKAKELVTAAANLSATFGGSLEENVTKLGKTLAGEVGRLGQLIPELKSLTKAQLESGEAALIINNRFGGAAASELNTYSGSVIAAKNAFSDLQEEIGGLIVDTFDLSGANSGLSFIYNKITTAIQDYNIAQQRSNGSLTESDRSVEQLKTQLNDLKLEYIELEQKLLQPGTENAAILNAQPILNRLNREIAETTAQVTAAQAAINESKAKTADTEAANPVDKRTAQEVVNQQKVNNEIIALKQQLEIDKADIEKQAENAKIENETARNAAELERISQFEIQKAEAKAANDILKAQTELVGEDQRLAIIKANAEKEIAINKATGAKIIADTKADTAQKKLISDEELKLKVKNLQALAGYTGQVSDLVTAIAKDGSKEAFIVSKAAALAQIAIMRSVGLINAEAIVDPLPGRPAVQAARLQTNISAGLAAATVAATAIKGFASGGIIGQGGATMGEDDTVIRARNGEMVLNAEDQAVVFNAIKSGSLGGGNIIIQVDGRTIAEVVRDQVRGGFKIGA